MKGDFTRFTFDPRKHYSRVLMQQGRVQLDADWNEREEKELYFLRALAADLIGPHGGPGVGFRISTEPGGFQRSTLVDDFTITPGHYYVQGILCVNEGHARYTFQDGFLADVFGKLERNNSYVVYLDVWERHVTYVEDTDERARSCIREVALRGPDTTTRTQIVWQVKCHQLPSGSPGEGNSVFKTDYERFLGELYRANIRSPWHGRLRARARKPFSGDTGPCLTSPEARYRGAENQLYRVEIHQGGLLGTATFKWSRENGAVIFPIEKLGGDNVTLAHLGHDTRFGLRSDDWVEIVDDDYVLQNRAEPLRQIEDIDPDTLQIMLKPSLSSTSTMGNDPTKTKHRLLRRWDSSDVSKVEVPTSNDGWITLEDGVEIEFGKDDENSFFRTGDYWLIPARVATGDVEWPGLGDERFSLPPHGVVHHYAPLAVISLDDKGTVTAEDCRRTINPLWS